MAYPAPVQGAPTGYPPAQPPAGYPPPQASAPGGYPPPQAPGGYPPPQQQGSLYPDPNASLASNMESMSLKPKAGTTALLCIFTEGNIITLESQATNQSLRINNGDVEGTGGRGKLAQFIVHVKGPGVVTLQNVNNTDHWLGIMDDKLIGTARGGPYCEFKVGEVNGKTIFLESTYYPDHFVGILPNGEPKQPSQTRTGAHGTFVPFLISESSPPVQPAQQHPPPVQAAPQPQLPSYQDSIAPVAVAAAAMPPQGYPQPTFPQQQPQQYPPQQMQYPPQQMQQLPPPPAGPQLPIGFNIMDSFHNGNVIQMICRGNGFPLFADKGRVAAKGFISKPSSHWVVMIPQGGSPGVIMLRNEVWAGIYLSLQKSGVVCAGKANRAAHFIVEPQPDNYCCFKSAESPHMYLNFLPNGNGGNKNTAANKDSHAQFFIRLEKQVGQRAQIGTPFGRPSIATSLFSDMVIQLYLKGTGSYLGINGNGIVYSAAKDQDPLTYFIVKDRGMGIFSFNSRRYQGFRLRMENSKLVGKGSTDLNSDFRLKDVSDGTVCFESVTCPNSFIGISVAAGLQTNLNVSLITIQKFGRTENVSKINLN